MLTNPKLSHIPSIRKRLSTVPPPAHRRTRSYRCLQVGSWDDRADGKGWLWLGLVVTPYVRGCGVQGLKIILPHVGLTTLLLSYIGAGAAIFQWLETSIELDKRIEKVPSVLILPPWRTEYGHEDLLTGEIDSRALRSDCQLQHKPLRLFTRRGSASVS